MGYGDPHTPGEFDEKSILFAGVNYLYEGITICYPVKEDGSELPKDHPLMTLATSSNGKPVICAMERSEKGGRVVVDSGFTKLFPQYWKTAGQARYVVNACVYLVDVEGRFGTEEKKKE